MRTQKNLVFAVISENEQVGVFTTLKMAYAAARTKLDTHFITENYTSLKNFFEKNQLQEVSIYRYDTDKNNVVGISEDYVTITGIPLNHYIQRETQTESAAEKVA